MPPASESNGSGDRRATVPASPKDVMAGRSNGDGMDFDAVLFDLDDTLYPYEPCNRAGKRAARRTANELGYDLDRDAFEALYQDGRRETKRELVGTASAHERYLYFKRALESHTGTHHAADALALGDAYWSAYVEEMALHDGVERALEELTAEGVDVGISTNLTTRIQLEKVHELGVEDHLDLLLTSEETGREKPASVMFTDPLARLDTRPSDAAFVGDDPGADVEGANAVGLTSVLFDPDGDHDDLAGRVAPDHHVQTFGDLTEVLQ